jgi:hypothetical protein
VFYAFGGGGSGGVMRSSALWNGGAGSWFSREDASLVETVRANPAESPQEVIA